MHSLHRLVLFFSFSSRGVVRGGSSNELAAAHPAITAIRYGRIFVFLTAPRAARRGEELYKRDDPLSYISLSKSLSIIFGKCSSSCGRGDLITSRGEVSEARKRDQNLAGRFGAEYAIAFSSLWHCLYHHHIKNNAGCWR